MVFFYGRLAWIMRLLPLSVQNVVRGRSWLKKINGDLRRIKPKFFRGTFSRGLGSRRAGLKRGLVLLVGSDESSCHLADGFAEAMERDGKENQTNHG
jgi:hypothetical protein